VNEIVSRFSACSRRWTTGPTSSCTACRTQRTGGTRCSAAGTRSAGRSRQPSPTGTSAAHRATRSARDSSARTRWWPPASARRPVPACGRARTSSGSLGLGAVNALLPGGRHRPDRGVLAFDPETLLSRQATGVQAFYHSGGVSDLAGADTGQPAQLAAVLPVIERARLPHRQPARHRLPAHQPGAARDVPGRQQRVRQGVPGRARHL